MTEAEISHHDHAGMADGGPADHQDHHGHDADGHADHAATFRDRFWLTLVLTVPVVYYSEQVQHWFGYAA
jgi:P-type Cu2+ transporter